MRKVNSFKFSDYSRKYKLVSKDVFTNEEGNEQRDFYTVKRPDVIVAKTIKTPDGKYSHFVEDLYQGMFIISKITSGKKK